MSSHILFVSTSNLATNPRLVKEIELALKSGYRVTALVCSFHNWSFDLNENVKHKLAGEIHLIEAVTDRSSFLSWVGSTFIQKIQQLKEMLGVSNAQVLSDVLIKRSILLRRKLKELKNKYQLVIAHNPGAFEPAAAFAKMHRIPLGIDVEDYHPGESSNPTEAKAMKRLIQLVLPQAAYVSVAAPLILEAVQKDCEFQLRNAFTILNYFNKDEFVPPDPLENQPLRCVWFSQNISFNRGLEFLLPLFQTKGLLCELHLYGNLDDSFGEKYLKELHKIIIHGPLPQHHLHHELCNYDIGLAVEPGKDYNNLLAISNKILSYYQAGLYILATDTQGQEQFLKQHPSHGQITSLRQLNEGLQQLVQQKETIRANAKSRYTDATKNHATAELQQLANCWEQLIKENP